MNKNEIKEITNLLKGERMTPKSLILFLLLLKKLSDEHVRKPSATMRLPTNMSAARMSDMV